MNFRVLNLVVTVFFLFTPIVFAQDARSQKAEDVINKFNCSVCHGEYGESLNDEWPNLAGQKAEYLSNELKKYRKGIRANVLMSPVAKLLGDEEIELVSTYYSQRILLSKDIKTVPSAEDQAKDIKTVPSAEDQETDLLASTFCAGCHGLQGISARDGWPNLAGQKSGYLINQINAYRSLERVDSLMSPASHLVYENEIASLANYYSRLPACSSSKVDDSAKPCHQISNGFREFVTAFGDGVYTYTYSTWSPVFLVTSEGAVVFDPINVEAAEKVKSEIAALGQKVRYVILTHAHGDHVGGANVFADEATIISHNKTKLQIEERRKMEMEAANRVGRTPNLEALPDITFSKTMTLTVGDKIIELSSPGESYHSMGDLITVKINNPKLLISVDGVVPYGFAFMDFRATPILALLDHVRALEKQDFEYFSNGHSYLLPKAAVTSFREYVEFILEFVEKSIAEGKTLKETQDTVVLPKEFASWIAKMPIPPMSEEAKRQALDVRLKFNVGGAYRQIKAYQAGEEVIDIHNLSQ
jgi:cytochrome c553/glyoxylase-like metal-dependent hydrolase (beta-lactamase superfamily II)